MGSFKSVTMEVFTPWKLANAKNQGVLFEEAVDQPTAIQSLHFFFV